MLPSSAKKPFCHLLCGPLNTRPIASTRSVARSILPSAHIRCREGVDETARLTQERHAKEWRRRTYSSEGMTAANLTQPSRSPFSSHGMPKYFHNMASGVRWAPLRPRARQQAAAATAVNRCGLPWPTRRGTQCARPGWGGGRRRPGPSSRGTPDVCCGHLGHWADWGLCDVEALLDLAAHAFHSTAAGGLPPDPPRRVGSAGPRSGPSRGNMPWRLRLGLAAPWAAAGCRGPREARGSHTVRPPWLGWWPAKTRAGPLWCAAADTPRRWRPCLRRLHADRPVRSGAGAARAPAGGPSGASTPGRLRAGGAVVRLVLGASGGHMAAAQAACPGHEHVSPEGRVWHSSPPSARGARQARRVSPSPVGSRGGAHDRGPARRRRLSGPRASDC